VTGIVLGLLGLTVAIALAGRLVLDLLAPERSRMVSAVLAYPFGQTVLVLVFVFLSNLLGTFYAFRGAMGLLGIAVLIQSYRALPRTAAFARAGAVSAHLPICFGLFAVSFVFLALNVGTGGIWHSGDFLVPVVSRLINGVWPPTLPQVYFTKVNGIHLYYISTVVLYKMAVPSINLFHLNGILAGFLPCFQIILLYAIGYSMTRSMLPAALFAILFYFGDFAVDEPQSVNSFAVSLTGARMNSYFSLFLVFYFYKRFCEDKRICTGILSIVMISASVLACDATGHMLLGVFFLHQIVLWARSLRKHDPQGFTARQRAARIALFVGVYLVVGLAVGSSDRLLAFFESAPSILSRTSFLGDVRFLFPVMGYSGLLGSFKPVRETFLHLPMAARFFIVTSPYFLWRWRRNGLVQFCVLLIAAMLLLFNQVILYMSGRLLYALGSMTVSLMCGLAGLFVGELVKAEWAVLLPGLRSAMLKERLNAYAKSSLIFLGTLCLIWSVGQSLLTGKNSYFSFLYKRNPNGTPAFVDGEYLRQSATAFIKYLQPKDDLFAEFETILSRYDPDKHGRVVLLNPATGFSSSVLSDETQREVMGMPPHWADNSYQDVAVFSRTLDAAFVKRYGIRFIFVQRPSEVYRADTFPFVDSQAMTSERFARATQALDMAPWVAERHEVENHVLYVVDLAALANVSPIPRALFVGGKLTGLDVAGLAGTPVMAAHVPQHRALPEFMEPDRIIFYGAEAEDLAAWRLVDAYDISLRPFLNVLGFNIPKLRTSNHSLYPPVMGHVHSLSVGLKGQAVEYDCPFGIVPQGEMDEMALHFPGWEGHDGVLMAYGNVWLPGSNGTVGVKSGDQVVGEMIFGGASDAFAWSFVRIPEASVRSGLTLSLKGPQMGSPFGNFMQISRLALVPESVFEDTLKSVNELLQRVEIVHVGQ